MRLRLVIVAVSLCLFAPVLLHADEIYTLSVNYSGIGGLGPGSTLQWQFETPSILTTSTTITDFLSASLGPGFVSQGCSSIADAQLPLPGVRGFSSQVITDFVSPCGQGNNFTGAAANFLTSITSNGVFDVIGQNGSVIGTLTISAIPEPPALSLLGTGFLALAGLLFFQGNYSRRDRKELTRAL